MERQHNMEELEKTSETRTERRETRAASLGVPFALGFKQSSYTSILLDVSIMLLVDE